MLVLLVRYKELELQKPEHNIKARQHKVDIVVDKEQPEVIMTSVVDKHVHVLYMCVHRRSIFFNVC